MPASMQGVRRLFVITMLASPGIQPEAHGNLYIYIYTHTSTHYDYDDDLLLCTTSTTTTTTTMMMMLIIVVIVIIVMVQPAKKLQTLLQKQKPAPGLRTASGSKAARLVCAPPDAAVVVTAPGSGG